MSTIEFSDISITPNPVDASGHYILSVKAEEQVPTIASLQRYDSFYITENGVKKIWQKVESSGAGNVGNLSYLCLRKDALNTTVRITETKSPLSVTKYSTSSFISIMNTIYNSFNSATKTNIYSVARYYSYLSTATQVTNEIINQPVFVPLELPGVTWNILNKQREGISGVIKWWMWSLNANYRYIYDTGNSIARAYPFDETCYVVPAMYLRGTMEVEKV